MTANDAVIYRIKNLCKERGMAINELANDSGIPPSTLYSIIAGKSKSPGTSSINKICNGFDISLREFYNCNLFDNLESEIR